MIYDDQSDKILEQIFYHIDPEHIVLPFSDLLLSLKPKTFERVIKCHFLVSEAFDDELTVSQVLEKLYCVMTVGPP